LWEIRTGNYRTFYYFAQEMVVVLHSCKKEDQDHGIKVAYKRMKELMEG
jgi:phage-related protein